MACLQARASELGIAVALSPTPFSPRLLSPARAMPSETRACSRGLTPTRAPGTVCDGGTGLLASAQRTQEARGCLGGKAFLFLGVSHFHIMCASGQFWYFPVFRELGGRKLVEPHQCGLLYIPTCRKFPRGQLRPNNISRNCNKLTVGIVVYTNTRQQVCSDISTSKRLWVYFPQARAPVGDDQSRTPEGRGKIFSRCGAERSGAEQVKKFFRSLTGRSRRV